MFCKNIFKLNNKEHRNQALFFVILKVSAIAVPRRATGSSSLKLLQKM